MGVLHGVSTRLIVSYFFFVYLYMFMYVAYLFFYLLVRMGFAHSFYYSHVRCCLVVFPPRINVGLCLVIGSNLGEDSPFLRVNVLF